jgi:hypothetical protein
MASLVLGAIGSEVGSSLLGSGVSFLGVSLTGAQIGGAVGTLIGSEIDSALMSGGHTFGPRLSDTQIQASTEGAPIPRLYGRVRIAGQLIWASQYKETAANTSGGGGKGLGGSSVTETGYTYSISVAVGLCAGATRIGRVWADGNLLDLSQVTLRFHDGSATQDVDPVIADIEGTDNAPAFRDLAYAVFEDLQLAAFGNRIPQLQFEVFRTLGDGDPGSLETALTGVALIPGAGEFVYDTTIVSADDGEGATAPQNAHNAGATADLDASLDELTALAPNLGAVSLVTGWFGDDLRAASCLIKPGVETDVKTTTPETWSVDGLTRLDAHLVSQIEGLPAYGGTPSDASIVAAIGDLKARGLRVMLCPFLFMDIPPGNPLGQPVYPWRGHIAGTTATAAPDIAAFFGTATVADFAVTGTTVAWIGGIEWSFRRMILHHALLCQAAGGVDAFLIGSELRGLTQLRDTSGAYPAIAALKTLAADVRAILPTAKLGYAADWSEYANHNLGSGAVVFNLDPLWSDANIDFIGIDNYLPLADWRDGAIQLDYDPAGPVTTYDPAYLTANIKGGEDYDWYYASDADRIAQTRTPITDGLGKPWVWRAKDLWNWWSNAHVDRPAGTELGSPTAWTPGSKPIWFTELGCPAIDKGANQPNVFVDPKSSESALPYFSNGDRDDLVQRRFLEAHFAFWTNTANNPASTHYSGRMVDTSNIYAWCWDARPYPFFPALTDVWGDGANWRLGHWLNGRLGAVRLPAIVGDICAASDFAAIDTSDLDGLVTGYAVTDTMSARDALSPLAVAFHFDAVETGGAIAFVARGRPTALALGDDDLAIPDDDATLGVTFVRAQETDLPNVSRIAYIESDADYRQASAQARRLVTLSDRVASSALPIVMDQGQALGIGERLLQDAWVMRETASFALPPSRLALDVTDEVIYTTSGRAHRLRLTQIDDATSRAVEAVATDPSIYEPLTGPSRGPLPVRTLGQPGRALVVFLDLPLLTGSETAWAPTAAAYASPWPGSVQVMRSASDANFTLDLTLSRAATLGRTTSDFYSGPLWRWDEVNDLRIRLASGTLASQDDLAVLGGANAIAIQNTDGAWEVLQFATATLTAPNEWTLTRLLRGQAGSEGAMRSPVAAGARVVLLDGAQAQIDLQQNEATLPFFYAWGPPNRPLSDASWQTAEEQFAGIGQRPLSPAQLAARWHAGDLILSWIRRTRIGGDNWDQTEVPLAEDSEAYDLEILDTGGAVIRTISSLGSPTYTYTASQIATDFPSGLPSPFRFTVYQLSVAFGRGVGATS